MSTSLIEGRRASLFAALGCTAGIVPHLLATVLGLSAILHTSAPLAQLLVLSGVFIAMTFAVFTVNGLLAHAFSKAVVESPRVQAWLRRGFASAFAGLGAKLALSER
ncbi:LysE family transporter [Ideonella sp. A 288]|uniref:LysE family transporter n=1 Tax=Ideonella sp. A 288 TaxID=1962181 RepID=UPI001F3E268A|nr:LysE family transporter [Ideonella sp. A 288]